VSSIAPATPLSRGLLQELEAELGAQGAVCVEYFRPGLSADSADELAAAHGLTLTEELRTWWGWHDGGSWSGDHGNAEQWIGPVRFAPLEDSLRLTEERRAIARIGAAESEGPLGDPEFWWPSHWIAVSEYPGGALAAECARDSRPAVVSGLHAVDWADPDSIHRLRVESMGELVGWWIDALRRGAWRWDATRYLWQLDSHTLPPPRASSGLA
jgi:hypothetical protein